jgi:outer membrane protein assembly factor BamB
MRSFVRLIGSARLIQQVLAFLASLACLAVLVSLASLAVLTSLAVPSSADWSEPRGDSSHSAAKGDRFAFPLYEQWRTAARGERFDDRPGFGGLLIADGKWYSTGGDMMRVDPGTRRVEWLIDAGPDWYDGFSRGVYRRGVLYVATTSGRLCAYEARTGRLLWKFCGARSTGNLPPALAGDTLYFASDGLYAVDAGTGELEWRQGAVGIAESYPAVWKGRVYVGADDGRLYCIDAGDGEIRWEHQTGRAISAAPVVHEGAVYFCSDAVYACDAQSGALRWRRDLDAVVDAWPAIGDGKLFMGADDDHLYAIDLATGEVAWKNEYKDYFSTSVTYSGGVVFTGGDDHIRALDAASGKELWKSRLGGGVDGWPIVDGGKLYVVSNGQLRAYAAAPPAIGVRWPKVELDREVTAGSRATAKVTVQNTGADLLDDDISIGIQWYDSDARPIGWLRAEQSLLSGIDPGASRDLEFDLAYPDDPGSYTVRFEICSRGRPLDDANVDDAQTKVTVRPATRSNPVFDGGYTATQEYRFDTYLEANMGTKKVALIVAPDSYAAAEPELLRYKDDVESRFDVGIEIVAEEFASKTQVRRKLQEMYEKDKLWGAVIVGDVPYAVWKLANGEKATLPLYYEDLKGEFIDSDGDGFLDTHKWDEDDWGPHIWTAWIRPPRGDHESLRRFFDKTHAYYTGKLIVPQRSLVFITHDWWMDCLGTARSAARVYGSENVVSSGGEVNRLHGEDLLARLGEPWDLMILYAHSGHFSHHFDEGPVTAIEADRMRRTNGGATIGVFWACHFGDFDDAGSEWSMPSAYLYGCGVSQALIGVTRSFYTTYSQLMLRGLEQGADMARVFSAYMRDMYSKESIRKRYRGDELDKFIHDFAFFGNPFVKAKYAPDDAAGVCGAVTGGRWDEPIAGAVVNVRTVADEEPRDVASTASGAGGTFALDLAPGDYEVAVRAPGYAEQARTVKVGGPAAPNLCFALERAYETEASGAPALVSLPVPPRTLGPDDTGGGEDAIAIVNVDDGSAAQVTPGLLGDARLDLLRWTGSGFESELGEKAPGLDSAIGYVAAAGAPVRLELQGIPLRPDVPVMQKLEKGWNLIGNPFDVPLSWNAMEVQWDVWGYPPQHAGMAEAIEKGWLGPIPWTLGPDGYEPASSLEPWRAYWVRAGTVHVGAYGRPTIRMAAGGQAIDTPALLPSDGWWIRMEASGRCTDPLSPTPIPDKCNYLAVSGRAADGYDPLDIESPPCLDVVIDLKKAESSQSLFRTQQKKEKRAPRPKRKDPNGKEIDALPDRVRYVDIGFADADWAGHSGVYAVDVRADDGGCKVWPLSVRSDEWEKEVRIRWEIPASVPRGASVVLRDVTGRRVVDMQAVPGYTFTMAELARARSFEVRVDPGDG